jgi:VIT1/CCC1 family predicted Fe2+/Mn2+ transporter
MIYEKRGLSPQLAGEVASQLMASDALAAHAHDELGILDATAARPIQAALTSAATFTVGAAAPLLVVLAVSGKALIPAVSVVSLLCLAVLGGIGARVGGAGVLKGIVRVTFWGALAMAVTAGIGSLFGAPVG